MHFRTEDDGDFETDRDDFDPPEDWTDSDESETQPCPYCGREIYEDAPYCPHCDHNLADSAEARPPRKPLWIIIGALACMYAFYRWITLR